MASLRAIGALQATRSHPAAQCSSSKRPPAPPKSHRASPAKSTSSTSSLHSPQPTRAAFPSIELIEYIPRLNPVPGRFQPVDAGQPFTVIVDYAHTDDALRNLTALARQITTQSGGRILTVFGCGGDRDRTKRPKMGLAAGEGSDFVVATSDNPRSEDPRAILSEIEPGLKDSKVRYTIEPDRTAAIHLALVEAKPHDVVLIAGKGHETKQILADRTIPFDDAEVALSTLSELGYGKVR
jgi:UDP-N-acetylmuramoyl-L-alanyl-D-glutamate--2,6-diaminopimelate ligase